MKNLKVPSDAFDSGVDEEIDLEGCHENDEGHEHDGARQTPEAQNQRKGTPAVSPPTTRHRRAFPRSRIVDRSVS